MPLEKQEEKQKLIPLLSPFPPSNPIISPLKKKKKIAQHRLASTNDLLFDEDGIIIAESDCWHRFNASLRSRIRSERSRGGKKSRGSCPTISNVTRNGEVTTPFPLLPTCPPRLVVARIHESVTLSLTKLAFTYASSIVRSVGLEVPRAFWNDVVGRGRFSPGRLEYDRHREACLPLYRPSPTAPLFSMADGQSYRPSTNSNFTRYTPERRWPALRLEKLQLRIRRASLASRESTTYSNPSSPSLLDYICLLSFVSYDFSTVLVRTSGREFDSRGTSLKRLEIVLRMDLSVSLVLENFQRSGKRNFRRD